MLPRKLAGIKALIYTMHKPDALTVALRLSASAGTRGVRVVASIKPRSILQLTIIGFLTVAAPLVVALVLAAQQVGDLGRLSQRVVAETSQAMRAGRMIEDQLLAMERNARQYAVLHDERLLDVYKDRRERMSEAARALSVIDNGAPVSGLLKRIIEGEQAIFDMLMQDLAGTGVAEQVVQKFRDVASLTGTLGHDINEWIERRSMLVQEQIVHTQRLLLMQIATLLGLALLIATLFTALITHPLRQLDAAIRRLGDGGVQTPIRVDGPGDLRELGVRLEWLRNRLTELEQQRIAFLRHVSHELKTPLTSIQEGVALIEDCVVGPLTEQQMEILEILHNQGRRLQRLIEELLHYNVGRSGVLSPVPRVVRLDGIVQGALNDHTLAARAACISMSMHLDEVDAYCDPDQVRVIIDNLAANALKYSPPGGAIHFHLLRQDDHAVLDVADDGPGIPFAERERIFEAFYQGSPPSREHMRGAGLGLAIARDFAVLNQGNLELVDSQRGARFRLRLPVSESSVS
jgi:two-component system sensor histidine kinase GlrK